MLIRKTTQINRGPLRAKQRGVVLIIALIVLVAMTLAGIALMRSVDTSNLISGNLAFQESATHSSDRAVERAVAWLEDCVAARVQCPANPPFNSDPGSGYFADGNSIVNPHYPTNGQNWEDYWHASINPTLGTNNSISVGQDAAGNTPSYIIDRLCLNAGAPTGGASCSDSPLVFSSAGNGEEAGETPLKLPSLVYYRITVRTVGPRNTVSYTQALVAM